MIKASKATSAQKPVQNQGISHTKKSRKKAVPAFGAKLTLDGLEELDAFAKTMLPKALPSIVLPGLPEETALRTGLSSLETVAKADPVTFVTLAPRVKARQNPQFKRILLKHVIPHPQLPQKHTLDVIDENAGMNIFSAYQADRLREIVTEFSAH